MLAGVVTGRDAMPIEVGTKLLTLALELVSLGTRPGVILPMDMLVRLHAKDGEFHLRACFSGWLPN